MLPNEFTLQHADRSDSVPISVPFSQEFVRSAIVGKERPLRTKLLQSAFCVQQHGKRRIHGVTLRERFRGSDGVRRQCPDGPKGSALGRVAQSVHLSFLGFGGICYGNSTVGAEPCTGPPARRIDRGRADGGCHDRVLLDRCHGTRARGGARGYTTTTHERTIDRLAERDTVNSCNMFSRLNDYGNPCYLRVMVFGRGRSLLGRRMD